MTLPYKNYRIMHIITNQHSRRDDPFPQRSGKPLLQRIFVSPMSLQIVAAVLRCQ